MTGMKATIIALEGELGAGKTYFAQHFGQVLGVKEQMTSPTFVIMNMYNIDAWGFKKLIHIDAYRLEREEELLNLGWEALTADPANMILIEWPEKVPNLIPPEAKRISFTHHA